MNATPTSAMHTNATEQELAMPEALAKAGWKDTQWAEITLVEKPTDSYDENANTEIASS